jgi:hypothetical protein
MQKGQSPDQARWGHTASVTAVDPAVSAASNYRIQRNAAFGSRSSILVTILLPEFAPSALGGDALQRL